MTRVQLPVIRECVSSQALSLSSVIMSAALCRYLDAPAAALACLHGPQRHISLPHVTMVFCAVDHAEDMKVAVLHMLLALLSERHSFLARVIGFQSES